MENINLKWKDVPNGWALCFNRDCPLRENCLRWIVGLMAPDDLTVSRCVMPHALKDGRCIHYATAEKQRYARGFTTIYDKVLKSDYTSMRKQMTDMLRGKRYYYEYMRGERLLSPAQQEQIREFFTRRGYANCVRFDDYEETLVFPWA